MKFSFIAAVLIVTSAVSAAEFGFTSPKENAEYHTAETVKFAWHDYTSKNNSITLVLANKGKAHHWHPYKDIAQLHKPFPTSYDWRIPKGIAKDRYFLVITDDTGSQPFSPYFYVK